MTNASGALSKVCQGAIDNHQTLASGPLSSSQRAISYHSRTGVSSGTAFDEPGAWQCIMAMTAERFVETPMFFLQSKFDHFQLDAIAGLTCMNPSTGGEPYSPPWVAPTCSAADIEIMKAYGADLADELQHVIAAEEEHRGLFLSACVIHGQSSPDAWIRTLVNDSTPQQAFSSWYKHGAASRATRGKWIEDCALPCNSNSLACAPY